MEYPPLATLVKDLFARCHGAFRLWSGNRRGKKQAGNVILMTALVIPVILGVMGLAIDGGNLYLNKHSLQMITDAAALTAGRELRAEKSLAEITAAAKKDAARNGYNEAAGDQLIVNWPPLTGPHAGRKKFVEVLVSRTVTPFIMQYFSAASTIVPGRAVGCAGFNDPLVIALDPGSTMGALTVSGATNVNVAGTVHVNSSNYKALNVNGGGTLAALKINIKGGCDGSVSPAPTTGVAPINDPLRNLQAPSYSSSACDYTDKKITGGVHTLSPGIYCGGIEISSATVTFLSGIYVILDGGLSASGGGSLNGDGVTFYFGKRSGDFGKINITSADVILKAPASGNMEGVLFFVDRNAASGNEHAVTVAGSSTTTIEGTFYLPNQNLKFAGGATNNGNYTGIICQTMTFTGNSTLNDKRVTTALKDPYLAE